MKIRTLFISVASVIALSSTAMADDHLFNAQQHGLLDNPHSQGFANGDKAPGQGSPFAGADTHTPASATVEDKPNVNIKERCLDPANPKCQLP